MAVLRYGCGRFGVIGICWPMVFFFGAGCVGGWGFCGCVCYLLLVSYVILRGFVMLDVHFGKKILPSRFSLILVYSCVCHVIWLFGVSFRVVVGHFRVLLV